MAGDVAGQREGVSIKWGGVDCEARTWASELRASRPACLLPRSLPERDEPPGFAYGGSMYFGGIVAAPRGAASTAPRPTLCVRVQLRWPQAGSKLVGAPQAACVVRKGRSC